MAPFLAIRLCQRFGISNPSPRLIKKAASAFRTGSFQTFGSGKYGCLKATIAAILLDREVQDTTLDADPAQGSLREPFLKIIHLMRSLEFEPNKRYPFVRLGQNLLDAIGQEPHKLPNVFSFFKPEYIPAGAFSSAGLVAPESQVLNGPTSVNMMNMMLSFVKYGANNCYGGLGRNNDGKYRFDFTKCAIGGSTNSGIASYNPSDYNINTAEAVVDDLSTLLTSGRLSATSRKTMTEAYEFTMKQKNDPYEAMINVQQLIVASPEFQTTNTPVSLGEDRPLPPKPKPSGRSYKNIIYVMLMGGADSFNMLVPNVCNVRNSDGLLVSEQYTKHRGVLALSRAAGEYSQAISAANQPCSSFVVHPELTFIKELYDQQDLLWVANAGVVNQNGMTKKNFNAKTKTQLFAHNAMSDEVKKVDPYNDVMGTGVLGRANDILAGKGHIVNAMNINTASIVSSGMPGKAPSPLVVSSNGIRTFAERPDGKVWTSPKDEQYFDIEGYAGKLNGRTSRFSGLFGEQWSEVFIKGIQDAKALKEDLETKAVLDATVWGNKPSDWDEGHLWHQFRTVSSLAQTHKSRNTDRELFYVAYGGFDHHEKMKENLRPKMKHLNNNLKRLVGQLKKDGLWDSTVIYVTSEFSRTITPNQSSGSDHGWGQNVMVLGGKVRGRQVLGHYPSDISPKSPLDDGTQRGRFIPTTSNDAIWNGILQWYGATTQDELDYCLPNRLNTVDPVEGQPGSKLFSKKLMFI